MDLKLIKAEELDAYRKERKTVLIDLREKYNYQKDHIFGAVNVPYEKLERYVSGIGKDIVLILYCDRGILSLRAGKKLTREGYRTAALAGGIRAYNAWRRKSAN